MRLPLSIALLCGLVLWSRDAAAWLPGPYDLERCVATFEVAVRGQVTRVEVVARRKGGWILSRAHLDIERAYHGVAKDTKRVSFYFWSRTDNTLTVAHTLAVKQRILVFLSTNLDPLEGVEPAPETTNTRLMLQFAKANNLGYLYELATDGKGIEIIKDSLFARQTKLERSLNDAEAVLGKRMLGKRMPPP